MQLTEAAAGRVRYLVDNAERPMAGLRVGIKKGGCAGMEYTLEPVETPSAADDLITGHGVNVYIDPKAVLFLLGSVMDYETTKLRSGFVFQNPNEVSSCGCGESVMLKPAEMPAG
jgi:iron-sulfur cluster assembly protein